MDLLCRNDSGRIAACPNTFRIEPRRTSLDIELLTVPGAPQNLTPATVAVLPWNRGLQESGQVSFADWAALVRAAVPHGVECPVDVENTDFTSSYFHDLTAPWRNLLNGDNDVSGQFESPCQVKP